MKRKTPRKLPLPPGEAAKPPAKIATRPLVQLVADAGLTPEELSEFTAQQESNLRDLKILNAKTNVTGFPLNKVELDALLHILDVQENKQALALSILTHASNNGLQGQDLENFGIKLARMGLHQ